LCTISKEQEEKYRKEYEGHVNYLVLPYQDDYNYKKEKKKIVLTIQNKYGFRN
jgi:hypothetical protein